MQINNNLYVSLAMKKKIRHVVITTLIIALGFITGSIFNSNTANALAPCPQQTCENDRISGWRCFSTDWNYKCDDSAYPNCSETAC